MSHLIIAPYDTVYTPKGEFAGTWHGLQTTLPGKIELDGGNIPRVFCPILQAGFKPDFDAPISNIPAELASELAENPITDWKVILSDQRANGNGVIPLHVAKEGYAIHQNKVLFDSMVKSAIEVLGKDGFEIATVGSLGAFSQFFVSIAIKGAYEGFSVGLKDKWRQFFNLVSSHNSLVASQTLLSLIRIVCMNTVQASIADAETNGTQANIRHTKNSAELITPATFAANLKAWIAQGETFKATLERLKGERMSLDGFRSFAAGVFTRGDSDELSTVSFNRITEMESLFSKGRGNIGETAYDGINAFTEYFTSGAGVGGKNVRNEKRVASANFGRGNEWKIEALRVASGEDFTEVCKRGEMLFSDKLKVESAKN